MLAQMLYTAAASAPSGSGLLTGLQAYYKLEDTSDSSGNGLNLTNHNAVTFVAGKVNNGAHISASTDQRLDVADNAHFHMGFGNLSLSAWFKTTDTSNVSNIAVYGTTGLNGGLPMWCLGKFTDGVAGFIWDGTNQAAIATPLTGVMNGVYHLVTFTVNRLGNLNIYFDGTASTPVDATGVTGTLDAPTGEGFQIGAFFSAGYNGDVDEVGVWNRELSSGEAATLWNGGAGITYPF